MERIWYVVAFAIIIYSATSYFVSAGKPVVTPTTPTVQTTTKTVDTTGLNSCLQQAEDAYSSSWENNCQSEYMRCVENGVSDSQCTSWYGGMCSLGNTVAGNLSSNLQRDKLDCYRQY